MITLIKSLQISKRGIIKYFHVDDEKFNIDHALPFGAKADIYVQKFGKYLV